MRRTVPPSAEIEAQIDELLAVGVGENPRESKTSSGRDMTVGGAELAGQAIRMGWSMSAICSLRRSRWVAASAQSRTTSACRSSSWVSAVSEAVLFTSTTA